MSSYELGNALEQARGLISEIQSNIQKYYPDLISDAFLTPIKTSGGPDD